MDSQKKILKRQAMLRHFGKILYPVSNKENWEDCFTIEELKAGRSLVFWYNLESGATHTESLVISET